MGVECLDINKNYIYDALIQMGVSVWILTKLYIILLDGFASLDINKDYT
jgi:hypothetical protein